MAKSTRAMALGRKLMWNHASRLLPIRPEEQPRANTLVALTFNFTPSQRPYDLSLISRLQRRCNVLHGLGQKHRRSAAGPRREGASKSGRMAPDVPRPMPGTRRSTVATTIERAAARPPAEFIFIFTHLHEGRTAWRSSPATSGGVTCSTG